MLFLFLICVVTSSGDKPSGDDDLSSLDAIQQARICITDSVLELPSLDAVIDQRSWKELVPFLKPAHRISSRPPGWRVLGEIQIELKDGRKKTITWLETGKNPLVFSIDETWYERNVDKALVEKGCYALEYEARNIVLRTKKEAGR